MLQRQHLGNLGDGTYVVHGYHKSVEEDLLAFECTEGL